MKRVIRKFNSNLLKDEDYVSMVRSTIEQYKNEHDYIENKEIQLELNKLDIQIFEAPTTDLIAKYDKLQSDFNNLEREKKWRHLAVKGKLV